MVKLSEKKGIASPLKVEPICSSETSVSNHITPCNDPEEGIWKSSVLFAREWDSVFVPLRLCPLRRKYFHLYDIRGSAVFFF
jgi:hypothetical protein